MLLRFGVENHLCFRERQDLAFEASSLKDVDEGLVGCEAAYGGAVVPAVLVYGANGSGKTSLLGAASTMKDLVMQSGPETVDGAQPSPSPFLLDAGWSAKPSGFEIDLVIGAVRYHYGLEVRNGTIASEWLYEIPKAHGRKLFERDGQVFEFGRWLKGQNRAISRLTRPDSPFLSAAAHAGHGQLSTVHRYFGNMAFIGLPAAPEIPVRLAAAEPDRRVVDFLKSVDAGIVGYRSGQAGGVEFAHRGRGGKAVYLEMGRESSGTRRLLVILDRVFRALDGGHPVFIDGLDTGLHPHVGEAVLRLFCSPRSNRNGAQLVATTHDTHLMKSPALRRDQLWFAEKNHDGATDLYPLTDLRTRKGDNLELGYLQGRYGAIPRGGS